MYIWTPWNDGATENAWGAVADTGSLHVSFVQRNQTTFRTSNAKTSLYPLPETPKPLHPHPLFPTYPRTVHGPRASAVLLFYTDQMNRVHKSEEALCSFTMAPCVVVERLEGKQRCSRVALGEHEGISAQVSSRWLFTKNRNVNKKQLNLATAHHNHDSAASRRQPLICTGAESIHLVHGPPKLRAHESMLRNRFTFSLFSRHFYIIILLLPQSLALSLHLLLSLWCSQRLPSPQYLHLLLPIKSNIHICSCSWMGPWNVSENLDSDRFWAGDDDQILMFSRGFPPFLRLWDTDSDYIPCYLT